MICHLAVSFLGIYPQKTIICKETYTSVFNVALFTIAKTWKQPKYPSSEREKDEVVYSHSGILLSLEKE